MSGDLTARLAALETRVALLEKALLEIRYCPDPRPQQWPVTPHATGCVCPVGAEASCGNGLCPRLTIGRLTAT